MSGYDSIFVNLECPNTGEVSEIEVQIKWTAEPCANIYQVGDFLGFGKNKREVWIKSDYFCKGCQTVKNHNAFLRLQKGTLHEIISEKEFKERGLTDFLDGYEI